MSFFNINNPTMPMQINIPDGYKELLEMAEKNVLTEPTELYFTITALAAQYYTEVALDEAHFGKLLSCVNQRSVKVFHKPYKI